jgi:molybdopterin molybdotransferase
LIGVLAAMGQSPVMVYRRPRVAIVSFGRELTPARDTPAPGQTRDCNGPILAALVARDGGEVTGVEILGDGDREEDRGRLAGLLSQSDLLLTIGGTAQESGDRALPILRQLGTGVLFWGVCIKPGGHSGAGMCDGKPVVALSGNPAACSIGYEVLAAPVLRVLQGLSALPRRLTAVCTNSFSGRGGPRRFLRGYVICGQDGWRVLVLPGQKSSMLRSLIDCNALIDLPAGHPSLEAGSEVSLILLW